MNKHFIKPRSVMASVSIMILFLSITSIGISAQVGINTDGSAPESSAMLEIKSTNKGLLPPRMSEAQRNAIQNPTPGLIIYCTDCMEMQMFNDTAWTNMIGLPTQPSFSSVFNPFTGETWMDRNLGASQVATSSTDTAAYGDLYQWGRITEGHEVRTSGITSTKATSAVPNGGNSWDGLFITEGSLPLDWLTPQDATLWQGISSTNNPCPTGYRLPTSAEWDEERLSWFTDDAAGAFSSPLKLPLAGGRSKVNGSLFSVNSGGFYWSSTEDGVVSKYLSFNNSSAGEFVDGRATGYSVRCIKD